MSTQEPWEGRQTKEGINRGRVRFLCETYNRQVVCLFSVGFLAGGRHNLRRKLHEKPVLMADDIYLSHHYSYFIIYAINASVR